MLSKEAATFIILLGFLGPISASTATGNHEATRRGCEPVTVRANIEVPEGVFSLADLLPQDTCPDLLSVAAHVSLGRAPLAGSSRVLTGEEVRRLLQELAPAADSRSVQASTGTVPERITIRRGGGRASCGDLEQRILALAPGPRLVPSGKAIRSGATAAGTDVACGVAGRIPLNAPLEASPPRWNSWSGTWEVSVRCVRAGDCVPFLLEVRSRDRSADPTWPKGIRFSFPADRSSSQTTLGNGVPLVRRGERVILSWDDAGIRIAVAAVALDAGAEGTRVRARLEPTGRILPAVVVAAGRLRTGS